MNYKPPKEALAILAVPVIGTLAYFSLKKKKSVRYLAIEAGGTNTRFAIIEQEANNPHVLSIISNRILKTETKTPEELINFIRVNFRTDEFSRIAISSFGPLNLSSGEDYGKVTAGSSPQKIPWVNYSLAKELSKIFQKEARIETDVNAAALAEHFVGYPGNRSSLAYITIGTGVGVGLVINDKAVHGFQHPEGGHNL
jgi:fructokinase